MRDRTFLILGSIGTVVLILVVIYFIFFRPLEPSITGEEGGPLFGEAGEFGGVPDEGSTIELDQQPSVEVAPRLVKITEGPVAHGVGITVRTQQIAAGEIPTEEGGTSQVFTEQLVPEFRFVERRSGNVYAYTPEDRSITRLSNDTIPGVVEAVWAPDASTVFLRFLSGTGDSQENLDTYALPAEGESETAGGFFLEPSLSDVVVSGSSTVATLLPSSSGSIATVATLTGANPRTLFSSPLALLRLYAAGDTFMTATYAASGADGYAFQVTSSGAFERLVGPLRALTILPSPSGRSVLYSYLSGNAAKAEVLDTATRNSSSLPLAVLPEKCAWAADEKAAYCAVPRTLGKGWPELWYQGVTHYSDRIWKIDLEARLASLVLDPETLAAVQIDAMSLTVDPDEDYLVFTNRTDGSLWTYDL